MMGWIKLNRKIMDWEWYTDANTARVFIHLLLMANHKEGSWRGVKISEGQHITSSEIIAKKLGITRQKVRTALNRLNKTGEIMLKSTKCFTIITIVNWAFYQREEDNTNQQLTNNQPTTNQQLTNIQPTANHKQELKELKNEKNEKNENKHIAPCPPHHFQGELGIAVNNWITYKHEKRQAYKPSGLSSFIAQVDKNARDYGDAAVIHAINESMAGNYQGVVWDKARGGVVGAQRGGGNPFFAYARKLEGEDDY